MKLSIVIPTYNRAEILSMTLNSIFKQRCEDYEVIVIDDGTEDDSHTLNLLQSIQKKHNNFSYKVLKHGGQGAARNLGISLSRGKYVLFLGDDIIPKSQDFLEMHLKAHEQEDENTAVVGFTDWDKTIEVTDFMKFLTNGSCIMNKYGGHQFAYEKLNGDKDHRDSFGHKIKEKVILRGERLKSQHVRYAPPDFFYTSNISIPRKLLVKEQFDLSFGCYGWEDVELGIRLKKKFGLKIRYQPDAVAYHRHEIHEKDHRQKMMSIGKSLKSLEELHPEMKLNYLKIICFKFLANKLVLILMKMASKISSQTKNYYYYFTSKKYFLEGYLHE